MEDSRCTVIAVVFIAIMRCIFTLMVVIFLIQHPFASLVLSGLASATVIAAMRRCGLGESPAGTTAPP
ncbi:hypothetical protein MMRN_p0450 (plasmid) [Mycobacterium marinum]|nr:hypothetical protein MMRN_p0450 [Mycobacterium marinum]